MTTSHVLSMLSVLPLLAHAVEASASTTLRLREPRAVPEASAPGPLALRAPAPPPPHTMWRPEWPTFSKVEGVPAGAVGVLFVLEPPKDPRWEGPILSESGARDVLRLTQPDARRRLARWGDVPNYEAPLFPFVVDPMFVAWLGHDDQKAAAKLATVGVSQLAADRHDATDDLAGSGMGFDSGYAVPTLLHYTRPDGDVSVSLSPGGPCTGACLKVAGSF